MAQNVFFDNYTSMYYLRVSDGSGGIIGFVPPSAGRMLNVTDAFGSTVTVLRVTDGSTAWGPDFFPFPKNYVRVIGDSSGAGLQSSELVALPDSGGGGYTDVQFGFAVGAYIFIILLVVVLAFTSRHD